MVGTKSVQVVKLFNHGSLASTNTVYSKKANLICARNVAGVKVKSVRYQWEIVQFVNNTGLISMGSSTSELENTLRLGLTLSDQVREITKKITPWLVVTDQITSLCLWDIAAILVRLSIAFVDVK